MATNKRKKRLGNYIVAHPWVDYIPALMATALWSLLGIGATGLLDAAPQQSASRLEIYVGLGTFCGLVLASATFVCTMTYQSSNILMNRVVRYYKAELRRNWVAILGSTLLSAVLALTLIAVDARLPFVALSVAGLLLSLTLLRGVRALYWLNYSLFGDELQPEHRPKVEVPLPTLDASSRTGR